MQRRRHSNILEIGRVFFEIWPSVYRTTEQPLARRTTPSPLEIAELAPVISRVCHPFSDSFVEDYWNFSRNWQDDASNRDQEVSGSKKKKKSSTSSIQLFSAARAIQLELQNWHQGSENRNWFSGTPSKDSQSTVTVREIIARVKKKLYAYIYRTFDILTMKTRRYTVAELCTAA